MKTCNICNHSILFYQKSITRSWIKRVDAFSSYYKPYWFHKTCWDNIIKMIRVFDEQSIEDILITEEQAEKLSKVLLFEEVDVSKDKMIETEGEK